MTGPIETGEGKTSIIIVTYNALDYVRQCLDSVLKYTAPKHEIVVVDNASDEPTRMFLQETARQHAMIRLIQNEENRLWSPGNNDGLRAMSPDSEFALLLNSDTKVLGPAWLQKLQAPFRSSQKIAVTGIQHNFVPIAPMYGAIDGCCFMFPRQLLTEVGYLDEAYPWNGSGFIFSVHAWAKGYKYYHVTDEDVLIHYGKRSRMANMTQLQNQKVDTFAVMTSAGLRPRWAPVAFLTNALGRFNANRTIGVTA